MAHSETSPKTIRSFRTVDNCHVLQEPAGASLGEFTAECGNVRATLSVSVYLAYLGMVDSGMDWFVVSLSVQRPPRWQGRVEPEVMNVRREMQNLSQIQRWLLELEPAITRVLFHDDRALPGRPIMRVLLSLEEQTRHLDAELEKDRQQRRGLLRA